MLSFETLNLGSDPSLLGRLVLRYSLRGTRNFGVSAGYKWGQYQR